MNPAPPIKRFFALCVDWAILTVASYILIFGIGLLAAIVIPNLANSFKDSESASFGVIAIMIIVLLGFSLMTHAYFIHFEMKSAQTPGKKLFGLRVVTLDGSPLTFQKCLYRELMRYVDLMLLLPGPICMIVTEKKQRLGDLVANTAVTHSKQEESEDQFVYISQVDYNNLLNLCSINSDKLTPELCNSYLEFSQQAFLRKVNLVSSETSDQKLKWEQQIRGEFLPEESEKLNLNQDSVLLYFAECCYQFLNKRNKTQKSKEEKWKHVS